MNKKVCGVIVLGVIVILGFIVFKFNQQKSLKINIEDVTKIEVTSLPSPPTTRTIENKDKIEKFVNELNKLKLNKCENKDEKGWKLMVKISGKENYTIQVSEPYITIGNEKYKVDKMKDLLKLLDDISIKGE